MAETTTTKEVKLTPNATAVLKHSNDINDEIALQARKATFNLKAHTYIDAKPVIKTEAK